MFVDFSEWDFRIGRPIANEGFLKALLTYGKYDTYEFFCPDVYHIDKFSKRLKDLIQDSKLLSRVKLSLRIALAESIQSEKYQVFHLGDFTYFMPYLIGIRNRYAAHPFPITGVTHSLDGVFMNLRYVELILSGSAPFDSIICTSCCAQEAVKESLNLILDKLGDKIDIGRMPEPRLSHIPLGIEETFFEEQDKASARDYFNIPENMIVALSVGRFSPRKKGDWAPILESLSRLYSKGDLDNLILIIAGGADKPNASLLESLISRFGLEKRVLLFPNFPPEVKTRLYRAADFYLSMVDNFQETFGLSVLEAMATGIPVICSDFSGYRELIDHGESGFLIKTIWSKNIPEFILNNLGILDESLARLYFSQMVAVDLEELQHAIMTLYKDSDLRTNMGLAGRQRAQAYRWEKVIHSYETLWADLSKEASQINFPLCHAYPEVLVGDPVKTFSHYPSKQLQARDMIGFSLTGREAIEEPDRYIRYEDIQASLFPELEKLIQSELLHGPQKVQKLRHLGAECLSATAGQVDFHLLWLLKHGVLSMV